MKSGHLLKTSLMVAIFNAANVLLTAIAGLYLAHHTTQAEYGQVVYFLNLSNVVLLVSGLGLSSQIILEVSRWRAKGDAQPGADAAFSSSFYSLLIVRLVSLFAFLTTGVVWSVLSASAIPLAASLCAALAVGNDFFVATLQGLQRTFTALATLTAQAIIYISLLLILPVNINNLMLAYALSFALTGVASVACVIVSGLPPRQRSAFDWRGYWQQLRSSASLYSIVLLDALYVSLPLVIIGAVGQYALAASLAVPLAVVGLLPQTAAAVVNMVYLPRLTSIPATDSGRRRAFFSIMLEGIGSISFIFAALIACYAPLFIKYLYTSRYLPSAPLLVSLAPLIFLLALGNLLTWSLAAAQRSGAAVTTLAIRLLVVVGAATLGLVLGGDVASIFTLSYLASAGLAVSLLWRSWRAWVGGGISARPFAALGGMLIVVVSRYALPDTGSSAFDELYKPVLSGLMAYGTAILIWRLIAHNARWGRLVNKTRPHGEEAASNSLPVALSILYFTDDKEGWLMDIELVSAGGGKFGGIPRYVQELSCGLAERGRVAVTGFTTLPLANRFSFLRHLPLGVAPHKQGSIVHFTQITGVAVALWRNYHPSIATVHDLGFLSWAPEQAMHSTVSLALLRLSLAGLRRMDAIIAGSEATRQAIIEQLGILPERVNIVYYGVDHGVFHPLDPSLCRLKLSEQTGLYWDEKSMVILYVGSELPRKNLATLLAAIRDLRAAGESVQLIKVGGAGGAVYRQTTEHLIAEYGLSEAVTFHEQISDQDLPFYYGAADMYVCPSYLEGFGLPVAEALACGLPVVCAAIPALREVAGNAAIYFAPSDGGALVQAIKTAAEQADRLRTAGIQQASRYQWSTTVEHTTQVYANLLGHKMMAIR